MPAPWLRCCGTLGILLGALLPGAALAKTYETRDAALERVFGDAEIERRTMFLTEAQVEAVQTAAGTRLEQARVTFYEARRGETLVGRAYLDTHLVRSLYETVLIVVDAQGRTRNVDILAFHEPEDYLPPPRWLRTLESRTLSKRLRPGDEIDALSGATLSARAAAAAVRRALALDTLLQGESK